MTKTVVITGANRGIGLELVRCYLNDGGWQVIASCRNPDGADALKALSANNAQLEIAQLDVSDAGSIAAFKTELGARTIDVLVNNAGIIGGDKQSFGSIDYDDWMHTILVNSLSPIRVTEALIDNVRQSENGKIVSISSQLGAMQYQTRGRYAYNTSKAALNRALTLLANELRAENIAVGMYHPGWVQTDMGGAAADITPPESAAGLFNCFNALSLETTGEFKNWNGTTHAW